METKYRFLKIVNVYENIDRNICSHLRKRDEVEDRK